VNKYIRTDALSVAEFACCGGPERCSEEKSCATEIVLPRKGVFVRRNRYGNVFADRTSVLFFEDDVPYEISHPVPKPDTSTVITLSRDLVGELCTRPGQDSSPFFGTNSMPTTSRILLAHWKLLLSIARADVADKLQLEERALHLVSEVFDQLRAERTTGNSKGDTQKRKRSGTKLSNKVALYLNENFRNPLSLSDVSAAVNCSRFYLCRAYKKHTGRTIHGHLTDLRLGSALEMLAKTQTSITSIALELGYSSHSHFTAQFRQAFRITPKRFRSTL